MTAAHATDVPGAHRAIPRRCDGPCAIRVPVHDPQATRSSAVAVAIGSAKLFGYDGILGVILFFTRGSWLKKRSS
jgi:hypothetical protein